MKRNRPKQHKRKLKSGRRITVNKGIKKRIKRKRQTKLLDYNTNLTIEPYPFSKEQVSYVQGVINNKMGSNRGLSFVASKARNKLESAKTIRDKTYYSEQLNSIRREVASNNQTIGRLEDTYCLRGKKN